MSWIPRVGDVVVCFEPASPWYGSTQIVSSVLSDPYDSTNYLIRLKNINATFNSNVIKQISSEETT